MIQPKRKLCPHCGKDIHHICKYCKWFKKWGDARICENEDTDVTYLLLDENYGIECEGWKKR